MSAHARLAAALHSWFSSGGADLRSPAVLEREKYILWHSSTGEYKRWMAIFPCIVAQMVLGSFYSTSVFNKPNDTLVWRSPGVNARMFIAVVASYGIATALGGNWVGRNGVFASVSRSLILTPLGWAAAGAAARYRIEALLYVYGALHGVGCALSYLSTTSALAQWYPDSKGLMAGVAVFGAGLGSFVWTLLARALMDPTALAFSTSAVMFAFSAIFFVALLAVLPFLRNPPPGYAPPASAALGRAARLVAPCARERSAAAKLSASPDADYSFLGAASTREFALAALLVFATSLPGVVFLSSAADMASNIFGLDTQSASLVASALNFTNFIGRAAWGAVTDRIGRKAFYLLSAFLQTIALLVMVSAVRASDFHAWLFSFLFIGALYGGGFGVLPALVSELFGSKISSATHGAMISTWALACVVGTPIFSAVNLAYARPADAGHSTATPSREGYAMNASWLAALPALGFVAVALLNVRREDRLVATATRSVRVRVGPWVIVACGGAVGGSRVLDGAAQAAEYEALGVMGARAAGETGDAGGAPIADSGHSAVDSGTRSADPGLAEWLGGRSPEAYVRMDEATL